MSFVGEVFGIPGPEEWVDDALCAQVDVGDLFFPERGSANIQEARSVCALCPVQPACLQAALANDEPWGIWGGASPKQRLRMRRGQEVVLQLHDRDRPLRVCGSCGDEFRGHALAKYCSPGCKSRVERARQKASRKDAA